MDVAFAEDFLSVVIEVTTGREINFLSSNCVTKELHSVFREHRKVCDNGVNLFALN